MNRTPIAVGVTAFLSIAIASIAFVLDTPLIARSSSAMALIGIFGIGLWGLAGLLLVRAPWSRWLLGFTIGTTLLLAANGDVALFRLSLGLGAVAIVGLAGPWLTLWVRRQPVGDPLGAVPVALIASGAAAPLVVGFGAADGVVWIHWITVLLVIFSAWAYGRGLPFGVWGFRIAVPITGVAAALATPRPGSYVIGAGVLAISAAAWSRAASRVTAVIAPPLPAPARRKKPGDASH